MVTRDKITELRPTLVGKFNPDEFHARTEAIAEAYRWGKQIHAGQKRLSGEPYFETHCSWVGMYLDHLVQNEAWTIAGLLHDAPEDRGITLDQIREHFPGPLGETVAFIVDGVTKLSAPHNGRSREIETLRKLARYRDPGVYLVKLADKTHNIMTLKYMAPDKAARKAEEAIKAYGRLAGILNCYTWRRWLEDMAFPFAEPETFEYVKSHIDSDPRLNPAFLNQTISQLCELMDKEGIDGRVEVTINGYWQSWQKLRGMARLRRASLNSFTLVNDLVSFRMLVSGQNERLCYALLAGVNRFLGGYVDQNRFDDYIACPQNGYRALQVTAWLPGYGAVEVAIATEEMEGENLWGIVHALQHGQDISNFSPLAILTPSGGVRYVPEGATVLDAIATIQQEFLLDKISAVKVNDSLARLSDKVQAGDVVEVVTGGPRLYPSEEWLNFCNSSTARLLRVVLTMESLKIDAAKGHQRIKAVLVERGVLALEDLRALQSDTFDNLLERLACSSLDDLYSAVGGGAIQIVDLVAALDEFGVTKQKLNWTSVGLTAPSPSNRPGVLAMLASLVSAEGGNILRSVNDTLPDGGFYLRLVIKSLEPEKEAALIQSFNNANLDLKSIDLV